MKQSELKQLIKEQILAELEPVAVNKQIYGITVNGEKIKLELDEDGILNYTYDLYQDEDKLSEWVGELKTLIVNNPQVKGIYCYHNQLTTLKLGSLPNLEYLWCHDNQLTSLDVSKCPNLKELNCANNQLKSLNISKCPNLTLLDCQVNKLTSLDISKCPNLKTLNCKNNQLTSLDLSKCPKLVWLNCVNNQLTSLDVSKCPNLEPKSIIYNKDKTQLIKEQILAELQAVPRNSFKMLLKRIPNEKYFYIIDENADLLGDPEEDRPNYNWTEFDHHWDDDLVDCLYDPIFDNELKGKPGVPGDDFNEFLDIDRRENPKNPGDEHSVGINVELLINKIISIISDYKKQKFSKPLTELQPISNRDKSHQIEQAIREEYPEIIEDGEIETGTEEWLFLLQLALKVYGLNIANGYDILKAMDGEGPYVKQIERLGNSYVNDLEKALENLGIEII
jgi:hypothetical protein